ncbi:MAG: hypothetical protein WBC44_01830 [Planctomycetaceae bacterium]
MPLTPHQVLDRLIAILPAFAEQWRSPDNCFRNADGTFSFCGAFAECSHYVRDHYETLAVEQRAQIADFIEECMNPPGTDLDNAAATCFLENLTFERFSSNFERHLKGHSLRFYRDWQAA